MEGASRTGGDEVFHQSLLGATTNASHEYDHQRNHSLRKHVGSPSLTEARLT